MIDCVYFNQDYLTSCTSELLCKLYTGRFPILFDAETAEDYTVAQCEDLVYDTLMFKYYGEYWKDYYANTSYEYF